MSNSAIAIAAIALCVLLDVAFAAQDRYMLLTPPLSLAGHECGSACHTIVKGG